MQQQLRPLSLGEILDRTAELYRNHFLLFAGIAAIFAGVMLVIQMLYLGGLRLLGYPHVRPHLTLAVAIAAIVQTLAILLIAGLAIAANNRAVAWVYLGQPASISSAARSIRPRLGRYLWLMTITSFRAWTPLAILYVIFFAVVFKSLPHRVFSGSPAVHHAAAHNPAAVIAVGITVLVLAPFFIGALVYGSWMSLRLSLGIPASVVEELPAGRALKRSVELTRGSLGRILVLGVLVYAVRMIIGLVLSMPFLFSVFRHPGQPVSIAVLSLQQVAGFITNTLIGPIYATGLTLFYYDQRIRKEGYDIEWMMQAAGLEPGSAVLPDSNESVSSNSEQV
jgi:hypothetical protein